MGILYVCKSITFETVENDNNNYNDIFLFFVFWLTNAMDAFDCLASHHGRPVYMEEFWKMYSIYELLLAFFHNTKPRFWRKHNKMYINIIKWNEHFGIETFQFRLNTDFFF